MLVGMLLCIVVLIYIGLSARDDVSSETGRAAPVPAVGAGDAPSLTKEPTPPSAPEMGPVWAAAAAGDPWPSLATNGRTGVPGNGVSLTFDDGPHPVFTPRVLNTLREHDVKATFFVVGSMVAENPDLVRRIVEEGHALGNHTYNHPDMAELRPAAIRRELQSTQKAVDDALGYHYPMSTMRPPYGSPYFDDPGGALPAFRELARGQGLFVVTWTTDPRDYLFDGRPEGLVRQVVRADKDKTGRGAEVILLHDTNPQAAAALPEIIAHYESSGSRFTTVDELLADKYASP